jgi:hypothetical protein
VSIDERRAYYRDNLWGPPVEITDPEWPEELRVQGIQQDLAQVWFPGAHSDVGGSYPQGDAAPANEALRWMIGELQNHGAELCQDRINMVLGTPSGCCSADAIYAPPPSPDHCIHDSLKGVWWLLQLFPQQYYDKENETIQWRVPFGAPRTIPRDSIVHGSAVRRMDQTVAGEEPYRPRNLKRGQVQPLQAPISTTTANLAGTFVYVPTDAVGSDNPAIRYAKLVVGGIIFGLFLLVIAIVGWYVVSLICSLLILVLVLVGHTPGVRKLLEWGLCRLR